MGGSDTGKGGTMGTRTFLALDIDEAARKAIAAAGEKIATASGAKVRWVGGQNLHVTLKFLGDVADAALAGVCEAVASAAAASEPFEFALPGLVCLPPRGRDVRMIWADVAEPTGRLAQLFERLEAALAPLGFRPDDRQFLPHVTVGRVKVPHDARALRSATEAFARAAFGSQAAAEVVVYASDLTRDGPVYTVVSRAKLGEPGAASGAQESHL